MLTRLAAAKMAAEEQVYRKKRSEREREHVRTSWFIGYEAAAVILSAVESRCPHFNQ